MQRAENGARQNVYPKTKDKQPHIQLLQTNCEATDRRELK